MNFKILDSGGFYKLEQVGPYVYHRPSLGAVWPRGNHPSYNKIDAKYERFKNGKGQWIYNNKNMKKVFTIDVLNLKIEIQHSSFGHLGLFAEQLINWKKLKKNISQEDRVLNLFAYTGVASLICAAQDAEVTHVDASKTSMTWAKRNQELSELKNKKIRWLIDDVQKFVAKEVRRKSKYDWIILDPPSFGRGNNNEVWQINEHLNGLMENLSKLKSNNFKGILLSSHSPGYSAIALENLLKRTGFKEKTGFCHEMFIDHEKYPLPSGDCAWQTNIKL